MSYLATVNPFWPDRALVSSLVAILIIGRPQLVGTAHGGPAGAAGRGGGPGGARLAVRDGGQPVDARPPSPSCWPTCGACGHLNLSDLATGFAGAWLAYSGLESLAQLAPSVREPKVKVIRTASALLVGSVLVTVPVFTAVAVEAVHAGQISPGGALLAAVAERYGGPQMKLAVVLTGAALLLLAAKLAFIGCYNVFQAIGEHGYLPAAVARAQSPGQPPRGAVVVITLGAFLLVLGARGQPQILAQLFAFGLLGSYTITSISLDYLRWRERRRGLSLRAGGAGQPGGAAALGAQLVREVAGHAVRLSHQRAAVAGGLGDPPGLGPGRALRFPLAQSAEASAAELSTAMEVLTLDEAVSLRQSYPSTTLLALVTPNLPLCREVARRAKGAGDSAVYVVYVDEIPGFLFPPRRGPSQEALRVLRTAVQRSAERGHRRRPGLAPGPRRRRVAGRGRGGTGDDVRVHRDDHARGGLALPAGGTCSIG